jgi:aldose 1-epimerase
MISGASFDLNGKRWKTSNNGKNPERPATIDGGKRGWGNIKLEVAVHMKETLTFFIYDRYDNGWPGIAGSSLTHTVTPFAWHMAYGSTPMRESFPMDLSHRAYWNLDGFVANSSRTIENQKLSLVRLHSYIVPSRARNASSQGFYLLWFFCQLWGNPIH